jgi:hypothetical protein
MRWEAEDLRAVAHTVFRTAQVEVERLFDVVVAEDVLPHVLHRWGPIPGVTGTRDLTGPWNRPGSERTVLLSDGNTARERVLVWERPTRFEYQVDHLSGLFGRLFDHAVGSWTFAATGAGKSRLRWTYTFHVPGVAAAGVMQLVARTAWARYMEQCADLCVARAELSAPQTP